jgi:hypothetical protein
MGMDRAATRQHPRRPAAREIGHPPVAAGSVVLAINVLCNQRKVTEMQNDECKLQNQDSLVMASLCVRSAFCIHHSAFFGK